MCVVPLLTLSSIVSGQTPGQQAQNQTPCVRQAETNCIKRDTQSSPVVDDLHRAVLLYPQFAQDNVVYAAVRVSPRVRLVVPGEGDETMRREEDEERR